MPRFTIGSILTGLTLAAIAIALWTATSGGRRLSGLAPTRVMAPPATPAGPMPTAIDPATGALTGVGAADPNDYDLADSSGGWDGDLYASTW